MTLEGTNYTVRGLRGLRTRKRKTLRSTIAPSETAATADDDKPSPTAALTGEEKITLIYELAEEIRLLDRAILGHPELPEGDLETEFDQIEEFEAPVRIELARLRTAHQPAPRPSASAMFHTATLSTPVSRRVTFGHPEQVITSTPIDYQPADHVQASSVLQYAVRPPRELDIAPEKFSGERLKFQQFKTQFELWVGRQPKSTPRERLMVLKKYVSDDPEAFIEPLELVDATVAEKSTSETEDQAESSQAANSVQGET